MNCRVAAGRLAPRSACVGLLALLLGCPLGQMAQAQTSAVIIQGMQASATPEHVAVARAAAAERLQEQGVRVLPGSAVVGLAASCAALECAHLVAEATGADVAVLVEVHTRRSASLVNVALVAADGFSAGGQSDIVDRNISTAAATALQIALMRYRVESVGEVVVTVEPSRARVNVDGVQVGLGPQTLQLSAGEHRIEAVIDSESGLPAPMPAQETVVVQRGGHHEVHLHCQRPSAGAPTPAVSGISLPWVVAGGALMVAGIVTFLIAPLPTLLDSGTCTQPVSGGCNERVSFGPAAWGVSIGALAAVVTGGVFLWLGLLSGETPRGEHTAHSERDALLRF